MVEWLRRRIAIGHYSRRFLLTFWVAVAWAIGLSLPAIVLPVPVLSHSPVLAQAPTNVPSVPPLPPLQAHPLPPVLAQWQDPQKVGDYFDQIQPLRLGYLVWSRFPVSVYIEPVQPAESRAQFSTRQAQIWIEAVQQAVQEWTAYLPLKRVDQPRDADITILRSPPPLRFDREEATGADGAEARPGLPIARARAADTRFEFYFRQEGAETLLSHRFTIRLRPGQPAAYTLASARHELGHALGIWGHSPLETDSMYFSQVRNPPAISRRDINTLKRIYQQPTRLGWAMPRS